MTKLLLATLFSFFLVAAATAQTTNPPFWNDIVAFKKKDAEKPPPLNAILLVGSSSFTRWPDVAEYFPGYNIINRGFGGSTLVDVIRYAYDIILPYRPRQVIIYCGENDFAQSANVTASDVVLRFKTLYGIIRQNLPGTVVHYISMKPSPSRRHLLPLFQEANTEIREYLKKEKNAGYIDVYDAMLDGKKQPKAEIFVSDSLHMNASGYAIWQKIMQPHLLR